MTETDNLKYTNERKRKQQRTEQINSCSIEKQTCTSDRSNGREGMKL
jgi:hypothetical protein